MKSHRTPRLPTVVRVPSVLTVAESPPKPPQRLPPPPRQHLRPVPVTVAEDLLPQVCLCSPRRQLAARELRPRKRPALASEREVKPQVNSPKELTLGLDSEFLSLIGVRRTSRFPQLSQLSQLSHSTSRDSDFLVHEFSLPSARTYLRQPHHRRLRSFLDFDERRPRVSRLYKKLCDKFN